MSARNFERHFAEAVRNPEGCLIWQGYVHPNGYARYNGQNASRVAYETFVGVVPEGMEVDHLCFTPRCVELSHLRLLTSFQNRRNVKRRPNVTPDNECINGHEFTPESTYIRPSGSRTCRPCNLASVMAYKARRAS